MFIYIYIARKENISDELMWDGRGRHVKYCKCFGGGLYGPGLSKTGKNTQGGHQTARPTISKRNWFLASFESCVLAF